MTATRQFLVTLTDDKDPPNSEEDYALIVRSQILERSRTTMKGRVHRVDVTPLPDLGADDSDLQTGFRRLAATLRRLDQMNTVCIYSEPVELSRGQIAALVAELSKQHPARTSQVDHAALDAVRAIRESDKRPGQQVQKNARAQLIITDAICRCVPEVSA